MSSSGATPYTYTWLFGDGSEPSSDESPRHVYTLPGEYTATVRVRDAAGKAASYAADIWVEADPDAPAPFAAQAFSVEVEADQDWGDAPLTVKLRAVPGGPEAQPPFEYSWEFGDGSPPEDGQAPTHVYGTPGEYWVMLTMEGTNGRKARAYRAIWVEEPGTFGAAGPPRAGADVRR